MSWIHSPVKLDYRVVWRAVLIQCAGTKSHSVFVLHRRNHFRLYVQSLELFIFQNGFRVAMSWLFCAGVTFWQHVACFLQRHRTRTAQTMRHPPATNNRKTPKATETSASRTSNRPTLDAERSRSLSRVKLQSFTAHLQMLTWLVGV